MMNRGILLFGYPGSGKGTQGRILNALPGFRHVAMGDILRSLTPKHPLYETIQGILRAGKLVSDDLVMELFSRHIQSLELPPDDFLVIDGVPRNARQVELLNTHVNVIKIFKLSVYDEKVVVDRLRRRAKAENRPDDASDEVIQHRLQIYRQDTESCIRAYPGTLLTRIHANQSIFEVHLEIVNALGKMKHIHFR